MYYEIVKNKNYLKSYNKNKQKKAKELKRIHAIPFMKDSVLLYQFSYI